MIADPRVRWPAGLAPAESPVFAHNELDTAAPARAVWAWLVAAPRWPEIYRNCKRLRIEGGGDQLAPGVHFTWWTFGVPVATTIDGFEVGRYLSWSGRGLGSRGHHVWLLDETATGCRIVTEETQAGAAARVLAPLLRRGLRHHHQRWIEGLARAASASSPEESP